ncbi:MAG: hypothetical protein M3121_05755 [Chloroflexota bacterium]|nr:hypothetical protein [Chloroflexota bacterium]
MSAEISKLEPRTVKHALDGAAHPDEREAYGVGGFADASDGPLGDAALLNDAITAGMRRYSARVPQQATTVAVGGGDRIVVCRRSSTR